MPWSYESGLCGAKAILRQRKSLIPYLYNCAYNSVENDVPVQAPPYIYYNDENIDVNTDAFMLGRDVLAKCVLDKGVTQVSVYLPKGDDWYLNETGKLYCGASTVKVICRQISLCLILFVAALFFPLMRASAHTNPQKKSFLPFILLKTANLQPVILMMTASPLNT